MIRQPVNSSNIKSIGYDSWRKELEIEFHDQSVHVYAPISSDEHIRLMNGVGTNGSIGQYFHRYIKGRFK